MRKPTLAALTLCAGILLGSCEPSGDYLAVAGGGFVFNYRIAEATYGVALKPMRELPADGVLVGTFENPAGGEPIVVRELGPFNPTRIALQTPPLQGVAAKRPYKVSVVLQDGEGAVLQRIEKTYASELDQSALPQRPLAIGPGYQKNIDESATAYPPSVGATPPQPAR